MQLPACQLSCSDCNSLQAAGKAGRAHRQAAAALALHCLHMSTDTSSPPPHTQQTPHTHQVVAQIEGDGSARIHITPLRASRALALRYLAQRHGVELSPLTLRCAAHTLCSAARALPPGSPALFAASDAEDLVGGVQSVLVVAPGDAAPGDASAGDAPAGDAPPGDAGGDAGLGGFPVDLEAYTYDGRLQIVPLPAAAAK